MIKNEFLVYKYRGGAFDRDLAALEEDYFWAASVESLNDPCEAISDRVDLDAEIKQVSGFFGALTKSDVHSYFEPVQSQLEQIVSLTSSLGVFSLSNNYNDDLLWAHYADSHRGFCVEYDLAILQKKLNSYHKHLTVNVIYSNAPSKIGLEDLISIKKKGNLGLLQKIIGTKPIKWKYEEETRLVTDAFGKHFYDFRALKSIYFGLRMPSEQKNKLMEALRGRGIAYYQMAHKNNSYEWYAIEVPDAFADSPRYKATVSPVQESAFPDVDELKSEFKQFAPYLNKAVEIQRRDPYCKEVSIVSFSLSESKPGSPIVYVYYKHSDDDYISRNFTLSEIDKLYALI